MAFSIKQLDFYPIFIDFTVTMFPFLNTDFFETLNSKKIVTERHLTLWRLSRKVEVPTTWEI